MQIASSDLKLSSNRVAVERQERREQLRYWRDGEEPVQKQASGAGGELRRLAQRLQTDQRAVQVQISSRAATLQPQRAVVRGADL
jgi:hypothetical protein